MYDITRPVHPDMAVWPGDQPPVHEWLQRMGDGEACNLSMWTLGSHTGTHVDAPSHFIENGCDIDQVGLRCLVGAADVLYVEDEAGAVTAKSLELAWPTERDPKRVLLKTRNSSRSVDLPFDRQFVALEASAAEFLVERGVATLGVDYLSVEKFVDDDVDREYFHIVHHTLLGAGIVVIEGLQLSHVLPGEYFLCCLPLLLGKSEAAPARAILLPADPAPIRRDQFDCKEKK